MVVAELTAEDFRFYRNAMRERPSETENTLEKLKSDRERKGGREKAEKKTPKDSSGRRGLQNEEN